MLTACMQLLFAECPELFDQYSYRCTNDVILLLNKPFSVAAGCENTELLPKLLKEAWGATKDQGWASDKEVEGAVQAIKGIFTAFIADTPCGNL